METNDRQPEFTENEVDLIERLRSVMYGEVVVFMQAGQPVRIEKGIESQKLGKRNN